MEKSKSEVYSLHRYIDESGAPDRDKIMSEIDTESTLKRHLDPDLMNIWHNQPEDVKGVIRFHISGCEQCRNKYSLKKSQQGNLSF
ncbi:MAG: hypothetical protein Q8R55_07765 [Candidatus Taylorbacteria bacterium]|nr:hypothetical protein [Candidatus Taylorbacteria bacterium]